MKTIPIYDICTIMQAGKFDALGFEGLKDDPLGIASVRTFQTGAKHLLTDLDLRWVKICDNDIRELTEWANRMELINSCLDEIDRHLAVAGSRLFNWGIVLEAMGFVNAFRVAAEQVINHNEQMSAMLV